jgi:putative tryptophan/tyrosine transport system substrate-binding protein
LFLFGQGPAKGIAMDGRRTRRHFVQGAGAAGLGLLAGCGRWPGQQRAPGGPEIRRIGVLGDSFTARWDAFREGLRELGWVEGQNLAVEYRWTEGHNERYGAVAAELVQLPVELIVAGTSAGSAAAKQATSTVPIVAILATGEALEAGLVDNIARPGGNITGMAGISGTQMEGKQLQLLTEAVPAASRVAILARATGASAERRTQALQSAAPLLGVQLQVFLVQNPGGIEEAFAAMGAAGAHALKILPASWFDPRWDQIADLTARYRLPTLAYRMEFPRAGGLMAYGVDGLDINRRAATYVDKLLKGAQPGDLPMERPMRFDFVINLKTAQALGLTIPPHVLLQATEVIQ